MLADQPALTVRSCAEPHHRQPIRLLFDPGARILSCPEGIWRAVLDRTFSPETPTVLMVQQSALSAARQEPLMAQRLERIEHLLPLPDGTAPAACLRAALADSRPECARRTPDSQRHGGRRPAPLSTLAEADMIDVAHIFTAPTSGAEPATGSSSRLRMALESDSTPWPTRVLARTCWWSTCTPSTRKLLGRLDAGRPRACP